VITADKNAAYPKAVNTLNALEHLAVECELRQAKYLNNLVLTGLRRQRSRFADESGGRHEEHAGWFAKPNREGRDDTGRWVNRP